MRIEPSAIPNLVSSLQGSLDDVGVQIEHAITELRIRPWAGDPVSTHAAEQFNQRSVEGGDDALTALCDYRDQLQNAVESLNRADDQYRRLDEDNAADLRDSGC
ncbi:hypothetical protein GCM10027174_02720 [Salinifilum aidingensis]